MDTLHKISSRLCNLGAMACALCSEYYFFFGVPYDTAAAPMIAFGFSIGFASIAAVISRDEDL
jgi:hypothetical protein